MCPIQDDEDGHLSYKLGDIIENETQRCENGWSILYDYDYDNMKIRYMYIVKDRIIFYVLCTHIIIKSQMYLLSGK